MTNRCIWQSKKKQKKKEEKEMFKKKRRKISTSFELNMRIYLLF